MTLRLLLRVLAYLAIASRPSVLPRFTHNKFSMDKDGEENEYDDDEASASVLMEFIFIHIILYNLIHQSYEIPLMGLQTRHGQAG